MKKLFIFAAMALIIGVGSVTVAEAHEGNKSGIKCPDGKTKHTNCSWGTGGVSHKHSKSNPADNYDSSVACSKNYNACM